MVLLYENEFQRVVLTLKSQNYRKNVRLVK